MKKIREGFGDIKKNLLNVKNFITEKIHQQIDHLYDIREKLKDLRGANYNLALYHSFCGNYSDAYMRFKLLNYFYKNDLEVKLAYIQHNILFNKFEKAAELFRGLEEESLLEANEDIKNYYKALKSYLVNENISCINHNFLEYIYSRISINFN